MKSSKVDVIDYGMGNIWSVAGAIEHLGYKPNVVINARDIENSRTLILPGVGSFRRAMESLKNRELDKAIAVAVHREKTKILGICLGMQLLCRKSSEDGDTEGLGYLPYEVDSFVVGEADRLKIPHVGFNEVSAPSGSLLFSGIKENSNFYFVHSYKAQPNSSSELIESTCRYGKDFLAAFEKNNVFGTQFHPEKSQKNGLRLLANFLSL